MHVYYIHVDEWYCNNINRCSFWANTKKSAGISHTEPLNGNTYFINQVEVDKFVDSSPNSIQNNVMMCQYNYL